jgi:hypothetical protein
MKVKITFEPETVAESAALKLFSGIHAGDIFESNLDRAHRLLEALIGVLKLAIVP